MTRGSPRPSWLPVVSLLFVTFIWGGTFVWMKDAMGVVSRVLGPEHRVAGLALFMALRFGIAAVIVLAISARARGPLGRDAWLCGAGLGLLLFAGFSLQMMGLVDVSPAVSAFLTSPYVLFTAFLISALERKAIHWPMTLGAVLATIGAGVIRGRPDLSFNAGELMTLVSAFVFAVHIVGTDRVTRRVDPMRVTFTSFVTVSAAAATMFAVARIRQSGPDFDAVSTLLRDPAFLVPLALTTLLATAVALTLMNVFQRELGPVRAAILYALEPIWATFAGLYVGLDTLTPWLWIGGAILLAGNLVAEISARREPG